MAGMTQGRAMTIEGRDEDMPIYIVNATRYEAVWYTTEAESAAEALEFAHQASPSEWEADSLNATIEWDTSPMVEREDGEPA